MADLVTHLCSGALVALPAPRWLVPLCVGVTLPDITGRAPQMAFAMLDVPLPNRLLWAFDVAHQPLPQVLLAGVFALWFRAEDQRRVLLGTLAGVALHFGLDVLQDHHGHGYYLWFPISEARWELGWIGSEATVSWAPWLLLVTGALWGARLWNDYRARTAAG